MCDWDTVVGFRRVPRFCNFAKMAYARPGARSRVKSSRHRSFPRHDVKDNNVRLGHGGGLPKGSQVLQLRKDGVREARNKVERDENECRFDPNSESMNSLVERQRTRCAHTFSEKPEMLLHDARAEG